MKIVSRRVRSKDRREYREKEKKQREEFTCGELVILFILSIVLGVFLGNLTFFLEETFFNENSPSRQHEL